MTDEPLISKEQRKLFPVIDYDVEEFDKAAGAND